MPRLVFAVKARPSDGFGSRASVAVLRRHRQIRPLQRSHGERRATSEKTLTRPLTPKLCANSPLPASCAAHVIPARRAGLMIPAIPLRLNGSVIDPSDDVERERRPEGSACPRASPEGLT